LARIPQAKLDATQQLEQKTELERQKKRMQELAQEKEKLVDRKLKTIGNYVHDSVPESDNEVWSSPQQQLHVCTDGL
jgi:seryl-tRNA synthetase